MLECDFSRSFARAVGDFSTLMNVHQGEGVFSNKEDPEYIVENYLASDEVKKLAEACDRLSIDSSH